MKIFVTGGAGFIGSTLVERLLKEGHDVTIIDNLWNNRDGKLKNIQPYRGDKHFFFIEGDIREREPLMRYMRRKHFDYVFHQAALADVRYSMTHPLEYNDVNVTGTINLLQGCVETGVKKFINASCYDDKTRAYIVGKGLVNYPDICVGDNVLTINPESRLVEEKKVKRVITQLYDGDMIHFTGRRFNLLITPNHQMLIRYPTKGSWSTKLKFEDANKSFSRSVFRLPTGYWSGGKHEDKIRISSLLPQEQQQNQLPPQCNKIPDEWDTKDLFYLMGVYLGDGCSGTYTSYKLTKTGLDRKSYLKKAKDKTSGRFTKHVANPTPGAITNSKIALFIPSTDKCCKRVEGILNKYGISYYRSGVTIGFSSRALCRIFGECGHNSHLKRIPRWVFTYSSEYLQSLLEGLVDSDGHIRKKKGTYTTVSKQLRNDIIELSTKLGRPVNFRKYPCPPTPILTNGRKIYSRHPVYRIHTSTTEINIVNGGHSDKTRHLEQYTGNIWCLEVEDNHNFLVERNGKVMFSGNSSSVYGNAKIPFQEDITPTIPMSPYAASKLLAEQWCDLYTQAYGLPTVSLRYFNVMGGRCRDTLAISIFTKNAFTGRTLEVFGGEQSRDYTPVEDVVEANMLAMSKGQGSYNIGTSETIKILDLANNILSTVQGIKKTKSTVKVTDYRKGEAMATQADFTKAKKELGWEPKIPFTQGLEQTVKWLIESRSG